MKNLEIIVSDNCSTDNTSILVNSFSDNRLKYIKQTKNLGANGNFNFCLRETRGTYILFLCDDDLIDPDFISICINKIQENSSHSFIRTGVRIIDPIGSVTFESKNIVIGNTPEDLFKAWFGKKTSWYLCNHIV